MIPSMILSLNSFYLIKYLSILLSLTAHLPLSLLTSRKLIIKVTISKDLNKRLSQFRIKLRYHPFSKMRADFWPKLEIQIEWQILRNKYLIWLTNVNYKLSLRNMEGTKTLLIDSIKAFRKG